jgi:hypothetical protein
LASNLNSETSFPHQFFLRLSSCTVTKTSDFIPCIIFSTMAAIDDVFSAFRNGTEGEAGGSNLAPKTTDLAPSETDGSGEADPQINDDEEARNGDEDEPDDKEQAGDGQEEDEGDVDSRNGSAEEEEADDESEPENEGDDETAAETDTASNGETLGPRDGDDSGNDDGTGNESYRGAPEDQNQNSQYPPSTTDTTGTDWSRYNTTNPLARWAPLGATLGIGGIVGGVEYAKSKGHGDSDGSDQQS